MTNDQKGMAVAKTIFRVKKYQLLWNYRSSGDIHFYSFLTDINNLKMSINCIFT